MKPLIRKILKEETEKSKINSVVELIKTLFDDVVVNIEVSELYGKPYINVDIKTDDPAANIETWYCHKIKEKVLEYTGDEFILQPFWSADRLRGKNADAFIDVNKKYYDDEEKPINESVNEVEKNLNMIKQILSTISWDGLCEIWVDYNKDDGEYEIRSKTTNRNREFDEELSFLDRTLRSMGLSVFVFAPWFVENCDDEVEFLN